MSSSTPILQGSDWAEEWRVYKEDGTDEDLTGSTLRWRLGSRTDPAIVDINSDDDAARFSVLDTAGSADVTGPVVRVNLTPTETGALAVGDRWHQLEVELADGTVRSIGKQPITVKDSLFD